MDRKSLIILFAAAFGLFGDMLAASGASMSGSMGGFLERHCFDCHDGDVRKGDLNLASLEFHPGDGANFKTWERVFERVRDGEMPPAKKPQPEAAEKALFLKGLKGPLLAADQADVEARGRVRSRRLTRVEYEHTVHDLLGIDVPLKPLLPEDPATLRFETVAAGQQLSHHQLARYLDVADLALGEAFDRALKKEREFRRFYSPDVLAKRTAGNYRGPDLRDGRSLSWPITLQFFGRMYATTVPADGWYRVTIRDVQAVNPGRRGVVWGSLRSGACNSSAPLLYMIGLVEATAAPRDFVYEAWIRGGHMLELKPNDAELRRAPSGAKGGNVSFKGRDLAGQGYAGIAHRGIEIERIHPGGDQNAVRENLFGDRNPEIAGEDAAGKLDQLLTRFARRAFRRPVSREQLEPYLGIGRQSLADGDSLVESLRAAYRAILCSPRFLTFIEPPGRLDDHAIASRLSYALWVSMPDAELTRSADQGRLSVPSEFAKQVDRLLDDPKAERFIDSFTDQWLKLKEIDFTSPDGRQFKTFDPVLQESMLRETRAFFAELVRADLGAENFVDSDFAFLNERLALHYRTESQPVAGDGLQKVSLSKTNVRGGLLTQGAILKVTADGTSTSPVVRGVFVNERILGQHIPPPPPGVPAIEPDIRGATSIRDQLDKHRSSAACASCHILIDPPGFALESFDPIGGWRTRYGSGGRGVVVDPSGSTPDGDAFADLNAWKRIYHGREEQLARAFADQFLTYATGAVIRMSDEENLSEFVAEVLRKRGGVRSILHAAIRSEVFLKK